MSLSPEFATDLLAARSALGKIAKDQTAKVPMKGGGSYSYTYADLDSIIEHVTPILAEHNLAVIQDAWTEGGMAFVSTVLVHRSGETLESRPYGLPASGTPQQYGSATTYARRYQLLAFLGLAAADDDDGIIASQGVAPKASAGHQGASAATPAAPLFRTREEAAIREAMDGLSPADRGQLQAAFKERFVVTLSQMSKERHPEAEVWVREWIESNRDMIRAETD